MMRHGVLTSLSDQDVVRGLDGLAGIGNLAVVRGDDAFACIPD
jgi:hypothetical protein